MFISKKILTRDYQPRVIMNIEKTWSPPPRLPQFPAPFNVLSPAPSPAPFPCPFHAPFPASFPAPFPAPFHSRSPLCPLLRYTLCPHSVPRSVLNSVPRSVCGSVPRSVPCFILFIVDKKGLSSIFSLLLTDDN